MHKTCSLRLLESSDLEFLERIENDSCLWKYSNTTEPYSHEVLKIYIQNAKQDIVEAGQQRFVISELDLHQLYAEVSIENTSSRALFKAAGYIETAVKKDWSYYENQFHDEIIVQKLLDV